MCGGERVWSSLERLVEADGGGAVEDDVDAAGELLHVLRADGEARLRQLAADGDDLLVEVGVVLPHAVEKLPETEKTHAGKKKDEFKQLSQKQQQSTEQRATDLNATNN